MKIPVQCTGCGRVLAELSPTRTSALCGCGNSLPVKGVSIGAGCVLKGGYRIEGPMPDAAEGFIAIQEGVDRRVHIKLLAMDEADEEELKRFQRQVKVSASLQHANIISAYHAGEDCGLRFLVLQYVHGESLKQRIDRLGAINEKEAVALVLPIAEALDYAWREKQVVHRNIKPVNIIIADGTPMLADLAIARVAGSDMAVTGTGFAIGTPEYMSPEQARGEPDLDCRCDIYAFGILLYELVTGRPPFLDASPLLVLHRQLDEEPVPPRDKNPAVSATCNRVILAMLAKDRAHRLASWTDVIGQLRQITAGATKAAAAPAAAPGGAAGRPVRSFSSQPRPRAAAALPAAPPQSGGSNWLYVILGVIAVVIVLVLLLR